MGCYWIAKKVKSEKMAKRFKFRISRVIPSFQSCRSKDASSLPENPVPVVFRLSPVNPKAIDIDFPTTQISLSPPSVKSRHSSSVKRQVSSAIVSVGCGCRRSKSGKKYVNSDDNTDTESSEFFKWKKEEKWHVFDRIQGETPRLSSIPGVSDGDLPPAPPPTAEKKKKMKQRNKKKKSKPRVRTSTSSADSSWFSSEGGEENYHEEEDEEEEETETLVSSSRSFSTDYSSDYYNPHLETITELPSLRRKKKYPKRVKKGKRYAPKSTRATSSPETESPVRLSVFRRLIPCKVEGKVRESFAVVKKSEDPFEDFKTSMLEMILEKQMFEARDLEQLLHCFLSLNAPNHHGVIVEAFSEIWEVLFCKSPKIENLLH